MRQFLILKGGVIDLLSVGIPLGLQRLHLVIVVQLLVFVQSIQIVIFPFLNLQLIPNVFAFFVLALDEVFEFHQLMLLL